MVQTGGNMCDEGVALGYIMQSKVKLKLAPLRRYSRESAENLNVFIYLNVKFYQYTHGPPVVRGPHFEKHWCRVMGWD